MLANKNPTHPDEISTNVTRQAFLAEMEQNWNVYRACKKLGIRRETVYQEWLEHDPEFTARYNEILAGLVDDAEENILEQAAHNKKAYVPAIFVLKSHRPDIYDRQAVNGRFQGNVTINIGSVANDTVDKLDLTGKASVQIEDDSVRTVDKVDTDNGPK